MPCVALVLLGVLAGCAAESAQGAAPGAAFIAPKAQNAQTLTITVGLSPSPAAAPVAPVVTAASVVTGSSLGSAANAPLHSGGGLLSDETTLRWSALHQLTQLLAGLSFAVLVKALCMASNVVVQVSPYPQVMRWESRRCTGEADAAPYVSIAFGGWQWCFYGTFAWLLTQRSGFLILVHSNCLGAVLGTYYTITFYRNCRDEASVNTLVKYLCGVGALAALQLCAMLSLPPARALFLTGLVASFCSFLGALSMLVTLPTVLRTGDSRSIPGPLVCANLGSSMVWVTCGVMLSDPLVAGPNVISAVCSVLCLYLKYRFPSKDDVGKQDERAEAEAGLKLASLGMQPAHKGAGKWEGEPSEATPLLYSKAPKASPFSEPHEEVSPSEGCADGTGGTF